MANDLNNKISIVAYTPSGSGSGHLHRIHLILDYLYSKGIKVLLITGLSSQIPGLDTARYDKVTLPRLEYSRKHKRVIRPELIDLYTNIITEVLRTCRPNIFLSTHHLGISGELQDAFEKTDLWQQCRRILLWRDIPAHPNEFDEWVLDPKKNLFEVLSKFYNNICILGQKEVFRFGNNQQFPNEIQQKICHMGYVAPASIVPLNNSYDEHKIVISFGGGENREKLLPILDSLLPTLCEKGYRATIVLGHYWSSSYCNMFRKKYCKYGTILNYSDRRTYLEEVLSAGMAFTSGGYNSVIETLFLKKRQIVMQTEDLEENYTEMGFRNSLLRKFGLIEIIHLNMSKAEIIAAIDNVPQPATQELSFDGCNKIYKLISESVA